MRFPVRARIALALLTCVTACRSTERPALAGGAVPVYNKQTGALEQLQSDRDGDGRIDTRAFMDGVRLKHIEIDRNGDGATDRWEFYVAATGATASGAPAAQTVLSHVEEAGAFDTRITRREFYQNGMTHRVEEDTDLDGRVDKWEFYDAGGLVRVELDLLGRGAATQRLMYDANGVVTRIESDPDGDGTFEPVGVKKRGS